MSSEEIKKTFSKNLKRFLEMNNKQPADLVRDLKFPFSTVSNWINGEKMPRMGNVELLADYFKIEKSDLIENKGDSIPKSYYLNDETAKVAQEVFENKDLKMLFDLARDATPDDIRTAASILSALKAKERGTADDTGI